MTTRNRMTWQRQKQASPPPASYGWTPDHPAFYPDPDADKYENGDTSSWAEDPTKGPYPQGPAPASVSWKPSHPAAKPDAGGPIPPPVGPDAGKKAALRQQVEKKAAKCIRIASAILGKSASTEAIENKALSLMDVSDRKIDAALVKMRQAFLMGDLMAPMGEDMDGDGIDQNDPETYDFTGMMDVEPPPIMADDMGEGHHAMHYGEEAEDPEAEAMLAAMMKDQGHDHEADDLLAEMLQEELAKETAEGEAAMKMAQDKTAAQLQAALSAIAMLQQQVATLKSATKKAEEKEEKDPMGVEADDDDDSEAKKLAALFGMKSAKKVAEDDDGEKKGEDKAEEEKMAKKLAKLLAKADDDEGEEEGEGKKEASLTAKLAALLSKLAAEEKGEEGKEADDDDDEEKGEMPFAPKSEKSEKQAYRSLFAEDEGDDDADDDDGEEVEVEVEAEETEGKKASLRPQARKASAGVKSLGAVRTASAAGGSDLSSLWKSAPDVSDHF